MAEQNLDWTAFAEQELRREREEVKQRGFTPTSEEQIGTWSQDKAGRLLCERLPVALLSQPGHLCKCAHEHKGQSEIN